MLFIRYIYLFSSFLCCSCSLFSISPVITLLFLCYFVFLFFFFCVFSFLLSPKYNFSMHFASYGNPASSSKTFPHWSGSPLFSMRWWPQRYADIVVKYFACISLPGYSGFFGALVYKYATKLTGFFICLFVLFSTINIFPLNFLLCLIWLTLLIFVTLFHLCVFLCKCRSYVCMSVWLVMPYLNCIYISILVYI